LFFSALLNKEAFILRKPLIAGNWKMYKTSAEAVDFVHRLAPLVDGIDDREIMIAPAFPALEAAAAALKSTSIALGAQDLFWEAEGAFTGQVAPRMLVACGCRYVLIGHSERRQYFGETDETVRRKLQAALSAALAPVVCVGETEKEREAGQTFSILDKQIKNGLKGLIADELASLVIAYEPVWAIGTGKTATADQAQEAHRFIRARAGELLGPELAAGLRILYGGSVKPENISELMTMTDIDGALVGGASLKADSFSRIVKFI
jgi:triosephosphate isomerase (TIM)